MKNSSNIDACFFENSLAQVGYKKGPVSLHGDTDIKCWKKYGDHPHKKCTGILVSQLPVFMRMEVSYSRVSNFWSEDDFRVPGGR